MVRVRNTYLFESPKNQIPSYSSREDRYLCDTVCRHGDKQCFRLRTRKRDRLRHPGAPHRPHQAGRWDISSWPFRTTSLPFSVTCAPSLLPARLSYVVSFASLRFMNTRAGTRSPTAPSSNRCYLRLVARSPPPAPHVLSFSHTHSLSLSISS